MDKTTHSPGYYRKQLYDYIVKVIGRELTEPEHESFKSLMKEYVFQYGKQMAQIPLNHIYTCKNCLNKVEKVGKKRNDEFKKRNKRTIEN